MKKLILLLITLTTLANVSYASFPVTETEILIEHLPSQDLWYVSLKNAILFLASSIFGVMLTLMSIILAFQNNPENSVFGMIAAGIIGVSLLFAARFYGKKVWSDKLSQKMIIGIIALFIIGFLFLALVFGGGSGMGG